MKRRNLFKSLAAIVVLAAVEVTGIAPLIAKVNRWKANMAYYHPESLFPIEIPFPRDDPSQLLDPTKRYRQEAGKWAEVPRFVLEYPEVEAPIIPPHPNLRGPYYGDHQMSLEERWDTFPREIPA